MQLDATGFTFTNCKSMWLTLQSERIMGEDRWMGAGKAIYHAKAPHVT